MVRYVLLLKFTDQGITNVKDSPSRAEAFKAAASRAGVNVESQFWTLGEYDGVAVFTAPDEGTAVALALGLGKLGNTRTCMLRAFDATEFRDIVGKMPS